MISAPRRHHVVVISDTGGCVLSRAMSRIDAPVSGARSRSYRISTDPNPAVKGCKDHAFDAFPDRNHEGTER